MTYEKIKYICVMNLNQIYHIILVLLSPLIALSWSLILFLKKDKIQAHVIMGIMLLVFTIAYFLFISYFTPSASMISGICYMSFALILPPLHVLFFKAVTVPEGISSKDFLLFVPNIILVLVTITLSMIMGKEASDALFHKLILNEPISVPQEYMNSTWNVLNIVCNWCFRYMFLAEIIGVQIFAFLKLRKFNNSIDDFYSDEEKHGRKNNRLVFLTMMAVLCAALCLLAKPFHEITVNEALFVTMSICVSTGIFLTGYYSNKIKHTAEQFTANNNKEQKIEDEPVIPKPDSLQINEKLYSQCILRLKEIMEDKKAYLNPELSLIEIASQIGTNRTYLTQIIHSYYDCSFSDYINLQRIEHSEVLLQRNQEMTMIDIATQSGYLTLSSFYRNFQKFTGTTPIKWREQFK